MGTINPKFGNKFLLLILQASGALPTTPTLWNGSTGNLWLFTDNVKGATKGNVESAPTEYRTNDDAFYDFKFVKDGVIDTFHYDRSQLPATFLETAIPTARAAGQRILAMFNLGTVSSKVKEIYQVGMVNEAISEEDDKPESTFPVLHKSTPPVSALALSTTYLKAINTATGVALTVQITAIATIPAAPTVRLVQYT